MIPARKNALFRALFVATAVRRIRRSFEAVHVRGLANVRGALRAGPVICVSNHVSWWDALVVLAVCERVIAVRVSPSRADDKASAREAETPLAVDGYALMDAVNLRRLPFFALVGAVGVDRKSPVDGVRALRYAASLLSGAGEVHQQNSSAAPSRLLWIFPQGEERASTMRPLGFEGGAALLAKLVPSARVVPVSFRYEPGATALGRLFIDFGDALTPTALPVVEAAKLQSDAVERLLDDAGQRLAVGDGSGYQRFFAAAPSFSQKWLERMLAACTRPLLPAGARPRPPSSPG